MRNIGLKNGFPGLQKLDERIEWIKETRGRCRKERNKYVWKSEKEVGEEIRK
jgi:hypothetical protein